MQAQQSVDSNSVTITGSMIYNIGYIMNSFVVTAGQAAEPPPTCVQSGYEWTITILANRQNSSPVADSFNSVTGGSSHLYSEGAWFDRSPSDPGQVTTPVYLGQGHTGLRNNRWIGGSNVTYINAPFFYTGPALVIGNSTFYLSGGASSFSLSTTP